MRACFVPAVAALALASACRHAPVPSSEPGDAAELWIRDVTLISPERGAALPHAHVVVRRGRIAWVGDAPPASPSPAARIIDGAGRYLVPGLIDGHVHLAELPGMTPEHEASQPAIVAAYFRQLPRSYLYFGFTAVVDLNVVDRPALDRLRAAAVGPAIFDCGNALALANGYPMNYLPSPQRFAAYPNFLYDPRQASSIPAAYAAADHTPDAAVGRVAAGGGICVKAAYEPGFGAGQGKLPTPTEAVLRDAVAASHRHRLPLLLHANSLTAHRVAAAVGVDAVAHGLWNWEQPQGAGAQGGALPDDIRRVLDDERAGGIAMMATLRVLGGLADLFSPAFLDDPRLARVLPRELIAWYRTGDGRWFARDLAQGFDGLPSERIQQILSRTGGGGGRAAAYFTANGGRLLFGSDTPSGPVYANPPGYNGYLEMLALEQAGIQPRQILAAATSENARFFGLAADYGTIEPGKRASLLVLAADPLTSVAAFDTIETVILGDRVLSRAELAAGPSPVAPGR